MNEEEEEDAASLMVLRRWLLGWTTGRRMRCELMSVMYGGWLTPDQRGGHRPHILSITTTIACSLLT